MDPPASADPNPELSAGLLSALAGAIWARFLQTGDRSDLDLGIRYRQEALQLRPEGSPNRARSLSDLAGNLWTRFQRIGDRNDLDLSILYSQETLQLQPEGHQSRAMSLSNLAVTIWTRFEQAGDKSDLDLSVRYLQEAVQLRPKGHPNRASSLSNLANALRERFEQNGNRSDLDMGIKYNQEVLNLWPEGHPNRATSLSNLAGSFGVRFEQTGNRNDLDLSIGYNREVLKLCPQGHPTRAASLSNLAVGLRRRFKQTRDRGDLDLSIGYHQEAIKLRPKGHPDRTLSLRNLATSLEERFEQTADRKDLQWSLSLAQEGAAHESSPVEARLRASISWVRIGRLLEDASVMEAYVTSVELLDRHVTFARSIGAQHSRLRYDFSSVQIVDLASEAASYALGALSPEMAVEILEQGRSILYSQLQNYRTSLEDLDAVNGELADQFRVLSARLEGCVISGEDQDTGLKMEGDVVARYQKMAADWTQVVERIRQVPGHSSFLKGKAFQELQLAASHGPVVIVNISQFRSDAIIVRNREPLLVIPLPDAPRDKVYPLFERFNNIAARPYDKPQDIPGALREIWSIIVEPVTIQLEKKLKLARGSRLWWMPTSIACSLPLHASGPYVKGKRNMPGRFTSSYTPTLSMLLQSLSHTKPTGSTSDRMAAPRLLLVSQANAEGEMQLPGVVKEMEIIQNMFPLADTLDGEACTRKAVLNGLHGAEWVHFACHGNQNQREPFKSYFSLHKEEDALTLLDIVKIGRPKAELAVLSACHSARGDERTPDEAVHMAAGMQFSGFKSVVGTLWASADEDGPIIAEAFYKHMLRNGVETVDFRDSAAALYAATRELRREKVPLERWINFVHYGA